MSKFKLNDRIFKLKDGDCVIDNKKGLYEFSRSCKPLTKIQLNNFILIDGVEKIETKYWIKYTFKKK